MFRTTLCLAVALLAAALALAAGAPRVTSVTLATGVEEPGMRPVGVATQFATDTARIHAVVRLEPVGEDVPLRGAWVSIDAIDVPDYEIAAAEVLVEPQGDPSAHFSISRPTNGWPAGRYEFRVSSRGALLRAAPFTIGTPGARPAAPATAPTGDAPRAGSVARHPAGFAFRVPAGWTTAAQGRAVRLLPPGAESTGGADDVTYVVTSPDTEIPDLRAADDPRLLEEIDDGVLGMVPGVRRAGAPKIVECGLGKGLVMDWERSGGGEGIGRVRAWVAVAASGPGKAGRPALLLAFTPAALPESDAAGLAATFATFTLGEPPAPAAAAPAAGPDAETRRKLEALDRAREAGVLSEEEYRRKRAEIVPPEPALDEAARKRLAALDAAREAGVISDAEYAAKKAEILGGRSAAPAAGAPDPAPPAAPSGNPTLRRVAAAAKGKTWRHPVGFSMWFPADWTLTEHEGFLQLAPADAEKTAEGPVELYFVVGESTAGTGITDPASPEVAAYLDGQVQSLAAFLVRRAAPKRLGTESGKGALLEWEGTNPRGDTVVARAYVCIVREFAVSLLSLGHRKPLEKRDADVGRIFASFRMAEGQRDGAVVGSWSFLESRTMSNDSPYETAYSRARMVSDSSSVIALRADGTWTRTTRRHMIAGAGGVWVESNDTKTDRGTWFAGDGRLNLVGEDQSWEEYRYSLNRGPDGGVQLVLASGTNQEFWARTQ